MPRQIARLSLTLTASFVLLLVGALPAFASGTKPDPELEPFLVGSLTQLGYAAIVGVVVGTIAFVIMDKDTSPAEAH